VIPVSVGSILNVLESLQPSMTLLPGNVQCVCLAAYFLERTIIYP